MLPIKTNNKIALVHDGLCDVGGAERVFQYLCEEFCEADIFTSCYQPDKTLEYFKGKKINVTDLNWVITSSRLFRLGYLLLIRAMKNIDLSDYDIVISSSASVAKYVTVKKGKHFSYCYYPTRAIWETDKYFQNSILKYIIKPFLPFIKRLDLNAAQEVDHFLAISNDTHHHIKKYYGRDSDIIHCPIDLKKFKPKSSKSEHFLIVSRLIKWKKLDYAIEAFNKIGYKLKVIGTGEEEPTLKKMSNLRLEREEIFRDCGSLRVVRKKFINNLNPKIKKIGHVITNEKTSFAINTDLDFLIAKNVLSKKI